jgi:hypothetical protein
MNKTASFIFYVFLIVVIAFATESCVSHDFPTYTPCEEAAVVSFQLDVKPIVESKCAIDGCHNGTTDLPNWNEFATFQDHSRNGSVKDFVIHRIMPHSSSPQGPLSQEQINTIACWIDHGALDN